MTAQNNKPFDAYQIEQEDPQTKEVVCVNPAPWDNLDVRVNWQNVNEVLKSSGLDFIASEREATFCYNTDNGTEQLNEATGYKVMMQKHTGSFLGLVKENYVPAQNVQVFNVLQGLIQKDEKIVQAGYILDSGLDTTVL